MEIANEAKEDPRAIVDEKKRQWKLVDEEKDQGMLGG